MSVVVLAAGLDQFADFVRAIPEMADEAGFLAINDTARDTVPLIRRTMQSQVEFPTGYLNNERLSVRSKATRRKLEARISARDRPTSLARFAPGATTKNTRTVRGTKPLFVTVKKGNKIRLDRAFLVQLTNGNVGLAIRLPKGDEPDRAYKPVELTRDGGKGQGVWLLYGPSVDQVMQGVRPQVQGEVLDMLGRNFNRHLTRIVNRG